jgi:hypothetical protein
LKARQERNKAPMHTYSVVYGNRRTRELPMGIGTAINLAKIRMLRGDTLIRAFDADGAPVFTLAVEHKGRSNLYAWQEEWTWHGAWKGAAPKPDGTPRSCPWASAPRSTSRRSACCAATP